MNGSRSRTTQLWTLIADELDIAPSLYDKAAARHRSLGDWLCRRESGLAVFDPKVRPQGSFRFGTVVKPIERDVEFDLDHVVVLERLNVTSLTQADLKNLLGLEISSYAAAYGMQRPLEKRRCWRLPYRDADTRFHLDSLPCVPATESARAGMRIAGVSEVFVNPAIAITDTGHQHFHKVSSDWLTSNPRGFARWFESRAALAREVSEQRTMRTGEVENVPPYRWKTPLQRAVQILKRHRDVMFRDLPELAPISMIITNLAAQAYRGEHDLTEALVGIVTRMEQFVRPVWPRVPNPVHPAEDYADKWRANPLLEEQFYVWMSQLKSDVLRWADPLAYYDKELIEERFDIRMAEAVFRQLALRAPNIAIGSSTAASVISHAAKPWGSPHDSREGDERRAP